MGTSHYIPGRDLSGDKFDCQLSFGNMLVGGQWQDVYTASATQNFDIGTRLAIDDRVFRYCYASTAFTTAMKACHFATADLGVNTAAVAYAVGTETIIVLDTATRAADYYKGGYVWIMDLATPLYHMYRIKSSLAAAAADNQVSITLDRPVHTIIPASTFVSIWPNIYSNCSSATSAYASMVAVNLIPVAQYSYFWGQTWGPCFGTAMSALPGAASADRAIFFNSDGALINGASLTTNGAQRAGYLITMTSGGGDQFYMLQLAP